jgi:hypothetical protein
MNGNFYGNEDEGRRYLAVSLGIFSIIRIVRPAQYVISATEYIIPDKECISPSEDDPCSVFRSMAFPAAEFTCGLGNCTVNHDKPLGNKCGC